MPDSKKKKHEQDDQVETQDVVSSQPDGDLENEELLGQLAALEAKAELSEEKYKRALADYQNLERHMAEANLRMVKLATKEFVESLVGPYVHLKMAASHLHDKGLEMVLRQFQQVFEVQGLEEINPVDQEFDAETMEAIETKEGKENVVLEVAQEGYRLNGIVIKPAKVVVGKSH